MYDVNYFIKKFEAIPDEKWVIGDFDGPNESHCAAGHCGMNRIFGKSGIWPREYKALFELFRPIGIAIPVINDEKTHRYQQETPKQRILAALYDIREETIKPIKAEQKQEVMCQYTKASGLRSGYEVFYCGFYFGSNRL